MSKADMLQARTNLAARWLQRAAPSLALARLFTCFASLPKIHECFLDSKYQANVSETVPTIYILG
jgi:hypothetical protein